MISYNNNIVIIIVWTITILFTIEWTGFRKLVNIHKGVG